MPKRATKKASLVFSKVLQQAEDKLKIEAASAENFDHRTLRGGERAAALASFLNDRLPSIFAVGGGEAIDYRDNRTGELDLFIYDRSTAAPIQSSSESALIPAEALYAVIEVKSVLSQDELNKCMSAGKLVRSLKPFKSKFIGAPNDGSTHENHYRCPYYVFAYTSNLGATDWATKELNRVDLAASQASCAVDILDRVFVLDRGMLHPNDRSANIGENSSGIFLDFYIHLINFLTRERRRRPAIDWTAYTSRGKWVRLK